MGIFEDEQPKKFVRDVHPQEFSEVWGNEVGGLVASLSAQKKHFRPNEPILISFQLKNLATRPQEVWHSGFWPNHRLIVKDSRGSNVPLTALGKETLAVFGTDKPRRKNFAVTLASGELDELYGPYDLRDYFQIGNINRLYVTCLYLHGSLEVFSNELILEIR